MEHSAAGAAGGGDLAAPAPAAAILARILTGVVDEPRRTAAALIGEFGSLGGLLAGSSNRIERLAGSGVAPLVDALGQAVHEILHERIAERPLLGDWVALLDYLRADLAHRRIEQVRLLHLDAGNRLIRDELLSEGTVDGAPVPVREVVASCLELGSAALILVHNHPSGDPQPSKADIAITHALAAVCRQIGIVVHDHLIIAAAGHVSLRARGDLA
ncbi:RadC family protein [Sphingomonas sp. NBWT7]|uniref:JAB domain-containing protein n=1 Tax=Sphingomonas sp. NBWT7 TaxID=2596913 RepID=UPI0021563C06|nr:DNA repair protein RadC [Sphingomonas sp. NBWT7]